MNDQHGPTQHAEAGTGRPRYRRWLGFVWAVLGVLATITGLLSFFLVDIRELLGIGAQQPASAITPAYEGEFLVLVTGFVENGYEADTRIYGVLAERVAEGDLENVRVEHLPEIQPVLSADAAALGDQLGASIVIWGTADSAAIEPKYLILQNEDLIRTQVALGTVYATDSESYNFYLVSGVPAEFEYMMLFSLGQIAYNQGDFATAAARFDEALALDLHPDRAEALNLKLAAFYDGYAWLQAGDLDAAAGAFSTAIDLDPGFTSAYRNRGVIYIRQGDYAAALADYQTAVQLAPDVSAAHVGMGTALYGLGRYAEAVESYTHAVELDPQNADGYNGRAYARALVGDDLQGALQDANRALALDPVQIGSVYDTRAFVYYRLGDYTAALADANQALDLGEAFAHYTRGLIYEALGDPQQAIAAYSLFIQTYPGSPPEKQAARERISALGGSAP